MNNKQIRVNSRKHARMATRVTAAAILAGASALAIGIGAPAATAAPNPATRIGGTGSADLPSLPLSGSAYTGSAGSNESNIAAGPAPSSGSGLGSAGSDGNIAGILGLGPIVGNTLSAGVSDGSSASGDRNTASESSNTPQPLNLGPGLSDNRPS